MKRMMSPILLMIILSGCSAKISGVVRLIDANAQPVVSESPDGIVVNMINTTAPLESASHSVKTNDKGEFVSEPKKITPGMYKVETQRIGYQSTTQTIEVGKFSRPKLELFLRQIKTSSRRSLKTESSDANKIVNPGEVNIQPPFM
jgi:PBP1b-binding outer membrane lipoprotein LpoB